MANSKLTPAPTLSVVIPVYNEELVLPTLFARLYPALDALNISYECVFVNDGSRDRSVALLRQQFTRRPRETRVVLFHANFGQHSAIMAGFNYARGDYVVTLDADLQNPPEEIGRLVEKLAEGYDYVGTIRQQRQDTLWRRSFSKAINKLREWITPVRITDQGCMMRGYARSVVTALNQTREVNTFIPALASLYAMRPIEVPVSHEERYAGQSKYSMYSLIRLNFDLITGFSVVPLQLFSMVGMAVATLSALLVLVLFVRRILYGPEAEGLFTLFGIVFFLIGVALFGIGLLGEYVGRIYAQVRERPRYIVEAVLEADTEDLAAAIANTALIADAAPVGGAALTVADTVSAK
ncbi:MAG: glycosyltransferase [Steroidobacteraceae bacterium]|jgi:undecaprenyl-phosphate 4-deoxy-4-formamido-L-arabinose transferase